MLNKLKFWKKKEPKMSLDEEEKVWYKNLGIKIPEPEPTEKEKTITEYKENIQKIQTVIKKKNKKLLLKKTILISYSIMNILVSLIFFSEGKYIIPIMLTLPTFFFLTENYRLTGVWENYLIKKNIEKMAIH